MRQRDPCLGRFLVEGFLPVTFEGRIAMTMAKIFAGGLGFAALAGAAPAAAQYYPYYYPGISTQAAVDRCTSAVQNRLSYNSDYYGRYSSGRVLSVTRVDPRRNSVRVSGIASSGRMAYNYGPWGIGAFGMLGYSQRADLAFRCSVDYRGRIRDIDLYRR
jgi:hypothetical protein